METNEEPPGSDPPYDDEDDAGEDEDDVPPPDPTWERHALVVQSLWRRFKARAVVYDLVQATFEKIWDPKNHRYYYYNKNTDTSTWRKPILLVGGQDLESVASTYTRSEAALMVQRQWRSLKARKMVAKLANDIILKIAEPSVGASYYYNPRTGWTSWERPRIMGPEGGWKADKRGGGEAEEGGDEDEEDMGDIDYEDPDFDNDSDGEAEVDEEEEEDVVEAPRKYPRSKAQVIVDRALDAYQSVLTSEAEAKLWASQHPEETTPLPDYDAYLIKSLDLSGLGCDRLTSRVYDIACLTELHISHNRLLRLSPDVADLSKLTVLDVSHNYIRTLPVEIKNMAALTTLNVGSNCLTSVPPQLYLLTQLTSLDLSHNLLPELVVAVGDMELLRITREWEVGVGIMTQLQTLHLHHNRLPALPDQMDRLTQLTTLTLDDNMISDLSDELCDMVGLEHLGLARNKLTALPDRMGELKALRWLDVSGQGLSTLPRTFGQLKALDTLILDSNAFTALPDNLGGCLALLSLSARHNQLTSVTGKIFTPKTITALHLDHNNLSTLPKVMGGAPLEALSLSYNAFTSLPPGFARLKSLTSLDLSHNSLAALPHIDSDETLPKDCPHLTHLDVSHNQLSGELSWRILDVGANSLYKLDISHNSITSLPERVHRLRDTVVELIAHDNLINSLPNNMGLLSKLTTLDLQHNCLDKLPPSMDKLKRLKHVDLAGNTLQHVPPCLRTLPSLNASAVCLHGNPLTDYRSGYSPLAELKALVSQGTGLIEAGAAASLGKGKKHNLPPQEDETLLENHEQKARQSKREKENRDASSSLMAQARGPLIEAVRIFERLEQMPHPHVDGDEAAPFQKPSRRHHHYHLSLGLAYLSEATLKHNRIQEIRRILFPAPKAEPTPESKKAEAEAAAALKAEEARKAVASKNKTTPKQRRELEAAKVAKEVEDNARRKREEDALKVSPELEASLTTEMDALRREKDALLAQCLVYLSQAKDLMDELRVPGQLGLEVVFNRARAYFMSNNMRDAIADLRQVLSAKPRYVPALLLMAQVREGFGQYPQARGDCFKIKYSRDASVSGGQVQALLDETRARADYGLDMLLQCGVNAPELERSFDMTPEGFMLRPRTAYIRAMTEGRSMRQQNKNRQEWLKILEAEAVAKAEAAWKTESVGLDRGKAAAIKELDKVLRFNQKCRAEDEARVKRLAEARKRREQEAREAAKRAAEERRAEEEERKRVAAEAAKNKADARLEAERKQAEELAAREAARKKREEEEDARDQEEMAKLLRLGKRN